MKKLPTIIAIDFDETITKFPYENKNLQIVDIARIYIQKLYDMGCYIIIWTCRGSYQDIQEMIAFLNKERIPYNNINDNHPQLPFHTSRKIYYDYLIDDKAFFNGDWKNIYNNIKSNISSKEII